MDDWSLGSRCKRVCHLKNFVIAELSFGGRDPSLSKAWLTYSLLISKLRLIQIALF